jgi:glycosyltransferase involved in cell wall biosynthesis
MKICHIIFTYPPYMLGGADIYTYRITRELYDAGNDVVIITTKPYEGLGSLKPSMEVIDGIRVYRFYPMNTYSWISPSRSFIKKIVWHALDLWNLHPYLLIRDILKKERPDIVHTHTPIWISMSVFSAVKSLHIPLAFSLHDSYLLCKRGTLAHGNGRKCDDPRLVCKMYRLYARGIVNRNTDVVISPSNFILNSLVNNGFFQGIERFVLPLGIKLNDKKVKKSYDTINILYMGAVVEVKGVNVLIDAFKRLACENITLNIVGKLADAEKFIARAGNDKRIIFHGFKSGKDLDRLRDESNITVLPSLGPETFGVAIIESFNHSTPVIGSRIGAYPDLIYDGINGFLFEPGNVGQLADILERVIEDRALLERLENGAYESVRKYDINGHVSELLRIYRNLLKPGS